MKKIVLLILLFLPLTIYAQTDKGYKIGWYGAYNQYPILKKDYSDKDGMRYLSGSHFIFTIKNSSLTLKSKINLQVGLTLVSDKVDEMFLLIFNLSSKEKLFSWKGSPVLLKLENDEVLELVSISNTEDKYGEYISTYSMTKEYEVDIMYEVDACQLKKIASGVKKIRLKINNEFLDVECYRYKKDYFSDFIQEESILLLQKLIDSKSKDIHDDF
ncbi:hypothetical protein [Phocaeicola vulgatus]|jgi:hypothetical protein|uniref:hypothetical protein n=1 Tax=Phocaeicola vulgatus TaxID=821 RepID=UPI000C223705|nr:hypothetical protein [Phocaeicola vulgatus]MDC1546979.1 hypothetical protein [Phocaeicola vulgatus]MDC1551379.1 hypothetical protein [Phocaeicola vulgatus]MDC1555429.1 hypothetical protein [Phocaeicola vulgatus]MDC1559686.1 hypothetical protein [Phocaeicola vulgatus]